GWTACAAGATTWSTRTAGTSRTTWTTRTTRTASTSRTTLAWATHALGWSEWVVTRTGNWARNAHSLRGSKRIVARTWDARGCRRSTRCWLVGRRSCWSGGRSWRCGRWRCRSSRCLSGWRSLGYRSDRCFCLWLGLCDRLWLFLRLGVREGVAQLLGYRRGDCG
ncbi:MAG: hypothetical protein RIS80_1132, partial [Actinomycetota bacterium]